MPVQGVEAGMTTVERKCSICGQPSGPGPRELRPYGKGGADVCYECVFGSPEREAEAERQINKVLDQPGPLVLDEEGIRPMSDVEKATMRLTPRVRRVRR